MTAQPRFSAAERAILPLLPMIYVAWADGELSPAELRWVRQQIPFEEAALEQWLDPQKPPGASALQQLLQRLQTATRQLGLNARKRRGLVQLGLELARLETPTDDSRWTDPRVRGALEDLEQSLGLYSPTSSAVFFSASAAPEPVEAVEAEEVLESLRVLLDGPQASWKNKVRTVLADPRFRHPGEITTARYREQTLAWCRVLVERGLTASLMPAAEGRPPDLGGFLATAEMLACFDLSLLVKFGVQFGLFGCSVLFLGNEDQRRRYLGDILTLELPGCFAMTERGHGSNVRDLETTARYDPSSGEFVIHTPCSTASKEWIGNAALHGRVATVFAQLEVGGEHHGVHAFLVPIRQPDGQPRPDVRIEDCGQKMGLNGVDNGRLWFEQVRIPRENLLSRFGSVDAQGQYHSPIPSASKRFFTMLGTLVGGRITIGAASVAVGRSALTIAIRYGARRRQFGPGAGVPILSYPSHLRRLMPRLAESYALHFALADLTERYLGALRSDAPLRELEAAAAGLKAMASWHAAATVQTCRECCGAQGYAAINRFMALKADSEVFTTFEGDNVVLLQLVAKSLLGSFRSQFADFNLLSLIRHLAQLASVEISARNPVLIRWLGSEHLRDDEVIAELLRVREQARLVALARGLKQTVERGIDLFSAFTTWQLEALDLARAHVERLTHERFSAVVAEQTDPALQRILGELCDLYGLWRIEEDRAWFLEQGYLVAAKSRAIKAEVTRLTQEVGQRSELLVDAFNIPATALGAPIAMSGSPDPG